MLKRIFITIKKNHLFESHLSNIIGLTCNDSNEQWKFTQYVLMFTVYYIDSWFQGEYILLFILRIKQQRISLFD